MQKALLVIAIFAVWHTRANAQASRETIAGLKAAFKRVTTDTARMNAATELAYSYRFSNVDSSNYYNDLARDIAVKNGLGGSVLPNLLSMKAAIVLEEGKLPEALSYSFEALKLAEEAGDETTVPLTLNRIGNVYMELEDHRKALDYYQRSAAIFKKNKDLLYYNELSDIGHIYERMGMADPALHYYKLGVSESNKDIDTRNLVKNNSTALLHHQAHG